jgi:hypothetical protein
MHQLPQLKFHQRISRTNGLHFHIQYSIAPIWQTAARHRTLHGGMVRKICLTKFQSTGRIVAPQVPPFIMIALYVIRRLEIVAVRDFDYPYATSISCAAVAAIFSTKPSWSPLLLATPRSETVVSTGYDFNGLASGMECDGPKHPEGDLFFFNMAFTFVGSFLHPCVGLLSLLMQS